MFIGPGYRTSWDSVKDAMDTAKRVLHHKTTLAGFEWVDETDRREMIMNGNKLSLDSLSIAAAAGMAAAVQHLIDNVLHGLTPYLIPRVTPVDQRRVDPQTHPYYSFLSDTSNPYVDFRDTLLRYLVQCNKLGRFHNGAFQWDKPSCHEFLEQCDVFKEMLYPLLHIQSGAVDRTTEAGTLTWCDDGWRSGSLKWAHGMVVLLSSYNKTNALTREDRPIARFHS